MDVSIHERSMSFFTEYDIPAPGRTLYAKKEVFTLLHKVDLQTASGELIAQLQGKFALLGDKYEFDLADGRVGQFECVDRLRSIYECRCGGDVFTLYEHRGLNRSIFQGDRQIAAYAKNRMSFGSGNQYEVRMDGDADLTLVVCMVLALSVSDDNEDKSTVNFDFGNIGPQGQSFDASWEPR